MTSSVYQRVLVLLDGGLAAERGLAWARQLVRGPGSTLHLMTIAPPARSVREGLRVIAFADQMDDAARASAFAYLDRVAAELREDGLTVATHVWVGDAAEVMRRAIDEMAAEAVVLGPCGRDGLTRDLLRRPGRVPVLVAGARCRRSA
jgi:nucleotide-binding universal stress UspA family protein